MRHPPASAIRQRPNPFGSQDLDRDARQDLLPCGTASRKSSLLACRCRSRPPPPSRTGAPDPGAPAPTAADEASPTLSGRSRSPGSASDSAPRSRPSAGGNMPADRKPNRQRRTGPVEDGACRHRCAPTASGTHEPPSPKPPSSRHDRSTGRRSRQAIAAIPGSPGSPHRSGTKPETRLRTWGYCPPPRSLAITLCYSG